MHQGVRLLAAALGGAALFACSACELMVAAIDPSYGTEKTAAWKRVQARYQAADGYEDVGGYEFFRAAIDERPGKRFKFCQPVQVGPHTDEQNALISRANSGLFGGAYPVKVEGAAYLLVAASPKEFWKVADGGPVCFWSDGERRMVGNGRLTTYPIVRWDGVRDEDEAAAMRGTKAAESNDAPRKPKRDPELPPEGETKE